MTQPAPRTEAEQAEELARKGYGVEDLEVKLRISRELAKWYVFTKFRHFYRQTTTK